MTHSALLLLLFVVPSCWGEDVPVTFDFGPGTPRNLSCISCLTCKVFEASSQTAACRTEDGENMCMVSTNLVTTSV